MKGIGIHRYSWTLWIGDIGVIMGVVAGGMRFHGHPLSIETLMKSSFPFLAAWIFVVWGLGYQRWATRWTEVWQAWAIGFPIGLPIRILLTQRDVPLSFAMVMFLALGVSLSLWRWTAGFALRPLNTRGEKI